MHNVQKILESFKPGCPEILELLKAQDGLGATVFHSAAFYCKNDMLKCLLKAADNNYKVSSCKEAREILSLQDNDGKTVLHYAARCSPKSVCLILTFFDITDSAVPRVWDVKDYFGQTFLSHVTDVETLRIFKEKLTTDMWVEFVTNIEHGRTTWIHEMMIRCNKDCLDFILCSLSADKTLQLLKAEDDTHSIPLDRLCDGLKEDGLRRYKSSTNEFLHGHRRYNSSTNEFLQKKELSKSIIIMVMELIKGVGDNSRFFLAESIFNKTVAKLRKFYMRNRLINNV